MPHAYDVKVSNGDRLLLDDHKWYLSPGGYVVRSYRQSGKTINLYLHQVILGKKRGMVIDHINGNKLDNRRSNLRFVSPLINSHNSVKTRSKSGLRGVSWSTKDNRFIARVSVKGINYIAGYFRDSEEASVAYYEKKAKILEGVV